MPIDPIGAVQGVSASGYLQQGTAVPGTDGTGFAAILAGAVDTVQSTSSTSKELAIKAVTGDLKDIHNATIASTQAAVVLELTAAVRNKAVDAFNEIMRMQA